MKTVTQYMFQVIDGRQVVEIRTGYRKLVITWPEGADVRIENTSDVTKIGEKLVLTKDADYPNGWDYPIPRRLLDSDEEWSWFIRDNPDEATAENG